MKSRMKQFRLNTRATISFHFNPCLWGIGMEYHDMPVCGRKDHIICSNIYLGPIRICLFVEERNEKYRSSYMQAQIDEAEANEV